jgi:hypothetical protein
MKSLEKYFQFRLAKKKDIHIIMKFIKLYWRKNHLLGKNKKFFEYEYLLGNNLNFMIAFYKKNKKIYAIQGFIPYSKIKKNLHTCGSITLVKPGVKFPFLGIETMSRMLKKISPKSYCGIGTNPITMKPLVEKFLNRHTDKMIHHYYLNNKIKDFKIAEIKKKFKKISNSKKTFYEKIKTFNQLNKKINLNQIQKNLPYKSKSYINKRYFNNPYFKYEFFIINKKNLLIGREIYLQQYDRSIFSIVDFVGNISQLGKINNLLNDLLSNKNYEYVDILCTGNISEILVKSGFKIKLSKDKNIIPIYFDPYLKKNISIFYETSDKKMVFFKGDADQDRINT